MSRPKQAEPRDWKAALLERFRDPAQGPFLVAGLAVAVCWFGVSWTLGAQATDAARRLGELKRKAALIGDVCRLRVSHKALEKHLPPLPPRPGKAGKDTRKDARADATPNSEWARHVLAGLRPLPVKLVFLEADKTRTVGPHKMAVIKVALEGRFADLNEFLRWIDANERLARVDRLQLEALPNGTAATLQVTMLGMMNG